MSKKIVWNSEKRKLSQSNPSEENPPNKIKTNPEKILILSIKAKKYSDVKINSILISPCNTKWKVIKKYASDMWLIKRFEMVCILTGGQFRKNWKIG